MSASTTLADKGICVCGAERASATVGAFRSLDGEHSVVATHFGIFMVEPDVSSGWRPKECCTGRDQDAAVRGDGLSTRAA